MTRRAGPTLNGCGPKASTYKTAPFQRALAWLDRHGIAVERAMTDDGSPSRSRLFASALHDAAARHGRTQPYTPRSKGNAKRFIQITLRGWAYAFCLIR